MKKTATRSYLQFLARVLLKQGRTFSVKDCPFPLRLYSVYVVAESPSQSDVWVTLFFDHADEKKALPFPTIAKFTGGVTRRFRHLLQQYMAEFDLKVFCVQRSAEQKCLKHWQERRYEILART